VLVERALIVFESFGAQMRERENFFTHVVMLAAT
jgi:hypothetical protein